MSRGQKNSPKMAKVRAVLLNPAHDATGYLLNGVVMCCACVFLLKYVLFALVSAHLRQDAAAKRRALLQLLPLAAFGGYVAYYFIR